MTKHFPDYKPVEQTIWTGRNDSSQDGRFFQRVRCVDVRTDALNESPSYAFLGFCSDEGIRRNLGRPGAKHGPDALREALAKLACHGKYYYLDVGNIHCPGVELEDAQMQFTQLVAYCRQHDLKTIGFGGGHEIAWPHFKGLSAHCPKLGIINFDAHFDARPWNDPAPATSGTSFTQIKAFCEHENRLFGYCCLGIQPAANTHTLFEYAQTWPIHHVTAEQMHARPLDWQIAFLDEFASQYDALYLTICLDVFAACYAPGVSAPQSLGLTPWQVLPLLKYLQQTGKVMGVDIAELSPPLDHDHKTARLAATIVAELLNTRNETHE